MSPRRIQQRRTKGWRKPEGAVAVGRGTKWGNPFRAVREGGFQWVEDPQGRRFSRLVCSTDREELRREMVAESVELYSLHIGPMGNYEMDLATVRAELAGRDLMCWCPLDQPCHADVLLELANGDPR